jgi:hypothetical protein
VEAQSSRRPTIGDMMILVATSCVALSMARLLDHFRLKNNSSIINGISVYFFIDTWIAPWLIWLSIAYVTMRLRRPRQPLRLILGQPGAVSALLCIVAIVFGGLLFLGRFVLAFSPMTSRRAGVWSSSRSLMLLVTQIIGNVISFGGTLVLGSWLTMTLLGRFRREPGWIDGLGIVVGAGWIAADLVRWISFQILV